MKYAEIINKKQYYEYSQRHLELGKILGAGKGNDDIESEYYILDLILEDYTRKVKSPFNDLTPVDLLKALMKEHGYTAYKLSKELEIPQSILSDILNYKRGFSKELIRKFATKFKMSPASFFKEYTLVKASKIV
ncbi:MAG TPA: helix-turn-helix transcriptional regulator [Taishania sp.]|nr:helix-turn-helix transcriptional regulator [Taishania sp.]